jgi:hypothetical protein
MNIANVKEKLKRTGVFIPFRFHFLLLLAALFIGANWLKKNNSLPETSRTAIIDVFIRVTFWFGLSILVISFLSAFIPWLLFLFNRRNNKSELKIKTAEKENMVSEKQQVEVAIKPIVKPPFGYIRLRLYYDDKNISPKFSPIKNKRAKNFFSTQVNGIYNWPLKNIKEYDINGGVIYFEDFFQFFSFALQLPSAGSFYTQPLKKSTTQFIVQPKKTEETNERIEEIRKVEGEYLNYKNFETNDDVRRIVWKIYAKNKELVVRIPETNDPYASHIYFYASFYNAVSNDVYAEFNEIFLNHYKTIVWSVFEQLGRQNILLQYLTDQETKTFYADDPLQKVKYTVSTSHWQKQNTLLNYFNRQYASLLCVSSLTDAKQLEEILDKAGKGLVVVFVPLSNSFNNAKVADWLQWLFIKPEKESEEKLKIAYNFSPLRRKIIENENHIKQLLKKCDCEILIMDN